MFAGAAGIARGAVRYDGLVWGLYPEPNEGENTCWAGNMLAVNYDKTLPAGGVNDLYPTRVHPKFFHLVHKYSYVPLMDLRIPSLPHCEPRIRFVFANAPGG